MTNQRIAELNELMAKLSYSFTDPSILNTALTHSSFVNGENRASVHNERMEFLGDAVLELCVSEYLYLNYPKMNEGMMTRTRSRAVYEPALYEVAQNFELGKYLLLSHGEENTGGREKPSILSDALEAVIGAMYLDGGVDCAKTFILGFVKQSIEEAIKSVSAKDYKTLLQEYVQHTRQGNLEYTVIGINGPDHKRVFTMQVSIGGVVYGFGDGGTKQEAGQNAAKATLELLSQPV
ncbi:MAG: ribonuclease III [Christensenellaceae bacterium]|nr:ribonuclease III [Christensenellaceae bacterium]